MVHLLDERMKKAAGIIKCDTLLNKVKKIKCETLRKYRIEQLGDQDWDETPEGRNP